MSKENIPHQVDPFRFAANAIRLQGYLPVEDMRRLSSSLSKNTGEVEVNVEFGIDEQGIRFMRGDFSTQLVLQCQRCMKDFLHNITGNFLTGFAHTEEEAKELPKRYDPIVVKELVIADVIEDELILGLSIPMHPPDECEAKLPLEINSEQKETISKENPFKVIELLRKRNSNKV